MLNPFTPGASIAVAVTASSVATSLPALGGNQIVVSSPAANAIAFIAFGTGSTTVVIPTTSANGYPILPGTKETLTVPANATHVAVIGSVSSTLYLSTGDGQ